MFFKILLAHLLNYLGLPKMLQASQILHTQCIRKNRALPCMSQMVALKERLGLVRCITFTNDIACWRISFFAWVAVASALSRSVTLEVFVASQQG